MNLWFRLYNDLIHDTKVLRLSDANFRGWVTLLCIASKNDGKLPPAADIALMLRVKPTKVAEWLAVLTAGRLIDNNDGVFSPHNWDQRQFKSDSSTERVQRFRSKKRNVSCNVTGNVSPAVSETPPDTDTETETEAEQKDTSLRSVDDWPTDFRERFWQAYPRKVGKALAVRKLETVRKGGKVTFAILMAGVERYATACLQTDPKYHKHPTTWLNAGCWDDEPMDKSYAAPTQRGGILTALDGLIEHAEFAECDPFGSIEGDQGAPRLLSHG